MTTHRASDNYYGSDVEAAAQLAGEIAADVVARGGSDGWVAASSDQLKTAREVERILARFNIGYVDDMRGRWAHRTGGSRFFGG